MALSNFKQLLRSSLVDLTDLGELLLLPESFENGASQRNEFEYKLKRMYVAPQIVKPWLIRSKQFVDELGANTSARQQLAALEDQLMATVRDNKLKDENLQECNVKIGLLESRITALRQQVSQLSLNNITDFFSSRMSSIIMKKNWMACVDRRPSLLKLFDIYKVTLKLSAMKTCN